MENDFSTFFRSNKTNKLITTLQQYQRIQRKLDREVKERYPAGSEIKFCKGNMTEYRKAIVEAAEFENHRIRLTVNIAGKIRVINQNDLHRQSL